MVGGAAKLVELRLVYMMNQPNEKETRTVEESSHYVQSFRILLRMVVDLDTGYSSYDHSVCVWFI